MMTTGFTALGFTEAQIDAFFVAAAELQEAASDLSGHQQK